MVDNFLPVDSAIAYFLAKSFIELPLIVIQCLVQYTFVYNMIGFQGSFILEVLCK